MFKCYGFYYLLKIFWQIELLNNPSKICHQDCIVMLWFMEASCFEILLPQYYKLQYKLLRLFHGKWLNTFQKSHWGHHQPCFQRVKLYSVASKMWNCLVYQKCLLSFVFIHYTQVSFSVLPFKIHSYRYNQAQYQWGGGSPGQSDSSVNFKDGL